MAVRAISYPFAAVLFFLLRGFHVIPSVACLPWGSVFGCVLDNSGDFFYHLTKRPTCTLPQRSVCMSSVKKFGPEECAFGVHVKCHKNLTVLHEGYPCRGVRRCRVQQSTICERAHLSISDVPEMCWCVVFTLVLLGFFMLATLPVDPQTAIGSGTSRTQTTFSDTSTEATSFPLTATSLMLCHITWEWKFAFCL